MLLPEHTLDVRCCEDRHVRLAVLAVVLDRPHLDRESDDPCQLAAPFQRGVEVGGLDQGEPAEMFLASVYGPSVVTTSPPSSRSTVAVLGGCSPWRRPRRPRPSSPGSTREVLHYRFQDLGRRWFSVGLVEAQQVLVHPVLLLDVAAGAMPAFTA
jgi:hypothetical protein